MPDLRRVTCRTCLKKATEVGPISWTGKCEGCAQRIVAENVLGLIEHAGPRFRRWREGMAASVGGVLLDERDGEA